MRSRDGSESNGYILSHDLIEDMELEALEKGKFMGDDLAKDLGQMIFELHRMQMESQALFWRIRRFIHVYQDELDSKWKSKSGEEK